MLINTAAGWRSIQSRRPPELREATTMDERRARMTDEIAELIPSMGLHGASLAASMLAETLAKVRS